MLNPSQPSVINGISLLTRKGDYKTRYSFEERLQLLDCSEEEFTLFMDIFARKLVPYAKAREQPRSWTTPIGKLTRNDVARHLLRDRIPNLSTIWIATRAWETTKWMGVDVDLGSGKRDFKKRRQQVRRALRGMGIQDDSVLYSPTPSGGCHYRVFFKQHIQTSHIRDLFRPFGIEHQNGRYELFPSTDQAMRLPFGHIPGRNCSDDEWKHLVRGRDRSSSDRFGRE
ncbi:MAG: hypothetical protein O3B86_03255 [Planctomycetota bacterium]|nr:hypothetical protein [Planctomycetota bacterium]